MTSLCDIINSTHKLHSHSVLIVYFVGVSCNVMLCTQLTVCYKNQYILSCVVLQVWCSAVKLYYRDSDPLECYTMWTCKQLPIFQRMFACSLCHRPFLNNRTWFLFLIIWDWAPYMLSNKELLCVWRFQCYGMWHHMDCYIGTNYMGDIAASVFRVVQEDWQEYQTPRLIH